MPIERTRRAAALGASRQRLVDDVRRNLARRDEMLGPKLVQATHSCGLLCAFCEAVKTRAGERMNSDRALLASEGGGGCGGE